MPTDAEVNVSEEESFRATIEALERRIVVLTMERDEATALANTNGAEADAAGLRDYVRIRCDGGLCGECQVCRESSLREALRAEQAAHAEVCRERDEAMAEAKATANVAERQRERAKRAEAERDATVRELKEDRSLWRFVPDDRGGHMLSATGDKWYPESLSRAALARCERLRLALVGLRLVRWRDDGSEDCWCATNNMPEEQNDGTRLHEDACTAARAALAEDEGGASHD